MEREKAEAYSSLGVGVDGGAAAGRRASQAPHSAGTEARCTTEASLPVIGEQSLTAEMSLTADSLVVQSAETRCDFIRKVYSILSFQLCIVAVIAFWIVALQGFEAARQRAYMFLSCFLAVLAFLVTVHCFWREAARSSPNNVIVFILLTLGLSSIACYVTLLWSNDVLLKAFVATGLSLQGLSAYAIISQSGVSGVCPYLWGALLAFATYPLAALIFSWIGANIVVELYSDTSLSVTNLCACIGVLLLIMYIIFDTGMILDGQHMQQQFCTDDFLFTVLSIYFDVLNLPLHLVQLSRQ